MTYFPNQEEEQIRLAMELNSLENKNNFGHSSDTDETYDIEDDELYKVLQLSEKEENHKKEKNTMDDGNDDDLKIAIKESMEEEKQQEQEKLRQEEISRAIEKQQQQEEIELEKALQLSKEQEQRDARHRILKEQDQAYQESLAKDMDKEQQQQIEEERIFQEKKNKEKEEDDLELKEAMDYWETLSKMSQKEKEIRSRLVELPPQPEKSDPSAVHLVIHLPDGKRVERFFLLRNSFDEVKIFVDSLTLEEFGGCNIPENYNLVTDFPRRVWENLGLTLFEAGFRKRQLIRVEVV